MKLYLWVMKLAGTEILVNIIHCVGNKTSYYFRQFGCCQTKTHRLLPKFYMLEIFMLSFACIHLIIVVHNGPAIIYTDLICFENILALICRFMTLYSYDSTQSIKHALFINCIDTQSTWYFWWEASNALILPSVEIHSFCSSVDKGGLLIVIRRSCQNGICLMSPSYQVPVRLYRN